MIEAISRVVAPARLRALRPTLMTATSALGLLIALAAAPGAAQAANACGTLTPGTTVTCPAGDYNGIFYGAVGSGNTVVLSSGTTVTTNTPVNGSSVYLSGSGDLTVNGGTSTTVTNNQTASGTLGMFVLTNAGKAVASADVVVTHGDGGVGVIAQGTTGATATANSVTTTGLGPLNSAPAFGIQAITTGAGNTQVTVGTVSTLGSAAVGVTATAVNGNTNVSANSVTTGGFKAYGINFTGRNAVINVNSVTTSGDGANAIFGSGQLSTTVTAGTIRTSGAATTTGGVSLAAGVNVSSAGTVNITTTDVRSTGAGGLGIVGVATGNVTVNAGTTATTGDVLLSNGINYAPTGMSISSSTGNVNITSGSMSTVGSVATGLRARATTGSITINSGTVSTQGNGSAAISAIAGGAVNITSTGAISTQGSAITLAPVNGSDVGVTTRYADAIYATSNNGAVTVSASGPISVAGDGATGIRATGATGVTITSSSITTGGVRILPGGITAVDASGIDAFSSGGPVLINTGAVTSNGADATAVVGDSDTGTVTVNVTGNVAASSATGVGVVASSGSADVTVNVSAGVTASGGLVGVGTIGALGVAHVTNTGRIEGTSASSTFGAFTSLQGTVLDTSGVIAGANGLAVMTADEVDSLTFRATSTTTGSVQTFGGDDVLTVAAGASLQGVDAGQGSDTLVLAGAGAGAARGASQTGFAGWDNIEAVNVASGNWTLSGAGAWNALTIASGASLTAGQTTGLNFGLGVGSSASLAIANSGSLTLQNTGRALTGADDSISMTGTGAYNIVGGALAVNTGLSGFTGQTNLTGASQLLALGSVGGGVNVASGSTLTIGGALATNNGVTTISGPGTAGAVVGAIIDNGAVVFNRSDSYAYDGALSGAGSLVKNGAGILSLNGANTFTGITTVNGGAITYGGAQSISALNLSAGAINLSSGTNTIGGLSGAGGTINLASGAILAAGSSSGTFAGVLAGAGSLNVNGGTSGGLNLTGVNTFTGGTTITSGLLRVNGSLASGVTVNGGVLGGSGTINGNVLVNTGGSINPGNSPGTMNVVGGVTFATGSTFAVEATATQADRIVATGAVAIQNGATLAITPQGAIGTYGRLTNYNLITGASLTGTFSTVTNTLAFLTPHLAYTSTALNLSLTRNDISFASLAANANQASVAAAAEATGYGAPLYMSLVVLDQAGSQTAFNAISGEGYANVGSALLEQAQVVRDATWERMSATDGRAVWGKVLAASTQADGSVNFAEVKNDVTGVLFGADTEARGWRLGASAGYIDGKMDVLNGSADATTTEVSAYAGGKLGAVSLRFGAGYAWHSVDISRQIVFPGFTSSATGGVDATTAELSAEAALGLTSGKMKVEPFASVTWDSLDTDAVTEAGGGMAQLRLASHTQSVTAARIGVRGELPLNDSGLTLAGSAAWRGLSGDTDGAVAATIGGQAFNLKGNPLDDSAIELGVRVDGKISEHGAVNLSYRGVLGDVWTTHSLEAGVSWQF